LTIATDPEKGKAMTIESNRPAFGPANIAAGAETGFARNVGERIGDTSVGISETAAHSITSEKNRVERARVRSIWPTGDVEDTDLERRVLAHERILQALIAHIAEAEPKFIARLSAVFSETSQVGRREHEYTDTHAYADQFIQEVLRLIARRNEPDAARGPTPEHLSAFVQSRDAGVALEGSPVTLLEVSYRSGIWAVTKDGRFYGHYIGDQSAFDAAEAAAFAVVASGGAADVLWNEARGQPGASDRAKGSDVAPSGVARTMEFRPGSARIVR
jgi:hypothetical protein